MIESSILIRAFDPSDAPELAEIFFSAVHRIAGNHYSAEQIGAWAPTVPDAQRFVDRAESGRTTLVVSGEKHLLAFGDLEPNGHIDMLYCRPEIAGTGVAASLYARLESIARSAGINLLYVEASEPARRFFLKHGFKLITRRDFELGGVAMHNYRMEKRL